MSVSVDNAPLSWFILRGGWWYDGSDSPYKKAYRTKGEACRKVRVEQGKGEIDGPFDSYDFVELIEITATGEVKELGNVFKEKSTGGLLGSVLDTGS